MIGDKGADAGGADLITLNCGKLRSVGGQKKYADDRRPKRDEDCRQDPDREANRDGREGGAGLAGGDRSDAKQAGTWSVELEAALAFVEFARLTGTTIWR